MKIAKEETKIKLTKNLFVSIFSVDSIVIESAARNLCTCRGEDT